ncbi:MAG: hypothetical protein N0E54_00360 [Candidatus Thiodiazotropha taylori]|nr:hypothetical protein [Candidatus Thiodiazotropha endolucinida]MCW4227168.1 hypothetical protein [Candidatus Thiodiazotropha taylori]
MSDENYKRLIEELMPLNHDRYKAYFVHFFAILVAIFAGIANDYTSKIDGAVEVLLIVGIVISVIWFLVQLKITLDIRAVGKSIENYENEDSFPYKIKISEARSKSIIPASELMLSVPLGFVVICMALLQT